MSATEVLQSPQKLTSQQLRKIKKPMIEKRRRERINESLNQLKALVLEALNKDVSESQYNKMEKADILEMTVKHLKGLQSRLAKGLVSSQPTMVNRYKTGYKQCADEVTRYLGSIPNVHPHVKDNLNEHLSFCAHKFEPYNNNQGNSNEVPKSDDELKADRQHITTAASPGHIMNSIQVGLPVMNGSQSMMLATTGPISPIHGTAQGFVPVIISPNNSVSIMSPVQAQQQQQHSSPHHHQVQTSPLPGSVIPLYSHTSLPNNGNCRSPTSNAIQSHTNASSPPTAMFIKDNNNQHIHQQNHHHHRISPKLSSYNSPSSPIMGEDVPKNNFPHYPEESFVSSQALDFVDNSKLLKTRDFYHHQTNSVGNNNNTIIITPTRQQKLSSPVSCDSTKLQHSWSDYAKDLHTYGREVLVHSPNGSPVWRPW